MSTYGSTVVAALPKLRVLGSGGAKSFDVQYGQNIVGRSEDCGLHLDLPSLSLEHAIIRFEEDGTASVEDLKSTNKTMLGSLDEPLELVRDAQCCRDLTSPSPPPRGSRPPSFPRPRHSSIPPPPRPSSCRSQGRCIPSTMATHSYLVTSCASSS